MMATNSLSDSWASEPVGRVAAPLREQVTDSIRQAILDFSLQPGQRLVERELMERLEVSRTTIREAIRELSAEGLVTVVPQKGAIVTAPSLEDAVDLYEVRASLESLVVQRFVERASDDQVARLTGAVDYLESVTTATTAIREVLRAKGQVLRRPDRGRTQRRPPAIAREHPGPRAGPAGHLALRSRAAARGRA